MRRGYSALFFVIWFIACAGVANEPIAGRPAHHMAGGFRNPNADFQRPSTWAMRWRFVVRRLWTTSFSPRGFVAPRVANDGAVLRAGSVNPSITWIGHATLLIQINGVDAHRPAVERTSESGVLGRPAPAESSRAGIRRFASDRCGVDLDDHYDHLDLNTVKRLAAAHDPLFLVPLVSRRGLPRTE